MKIVDSFFISTPVNLGETGSKRAKTKKVNKGCCATWWSNLHHYFDRGVCLSFRTCVRTCVRHKIFFSPKSPWNHLLTAGVEPRVTQPLRRS